MTEKITSQAIRLKRAGYEGLYRGKWYMIMPGNCSYRRKDGATPWEELQVRENNN